MNKRASQLRAVLIGVVALMSAGSVSAQTTGAIRIGQNVSGALRAGDGARPTGQYVDTFAFEGEYGQQIEIRMNAPGFDPLIAVSGPSNFQAENDDDTESSEPLRNSRLVLTLPQSGRYTIQATSYAAGATGAYTLRLLPASGASPQSASASQGEVLSFGQPARGALAQGDGQLRSGEFADAFRFLGQAGQRISIDMRSSDLDAYLIVVPPEGQQIDNDDFEGQGANSRVELTLTASGEYRVIATTYRPGETGAYEVVVNEAGGGREIADGGASGEDVALDRTSSGSLAQGDQTLSSGEFYDTYSFSGRRGQRVSVEMTSSEIDTYLIVVPPEGEQVDNDDFAGLGTNSRVDLTLPANGEYTIIATSYQPGESGAYTLRVARGAGSAPVNVAGQGRVYLLSVGISDYAGFANNLDFTADDARNLYSALQSNGSLAPESVLLTDAQATRANVQAAFQRIAARVGPNDLFLFFYSGHGSQEGASDGAELDGRDESIVMRDGLITDNEMARWFSQVNGRLSVIALDSCFSGGFARDVVNRPRVMGLFSSDEDLTSAVAGKFRAGGYLSHFLHTGIQGEADENGDRTITAGELHAYLWRRFAAEPNIGASSMDGESNYQRLVVDRGGVKVDDLVLALR